MKVLEIGPSFRPTCSRADGWNAYSLDHATADELRKKYRQHEGVDVDKIEEVDFVWRQGTILSAVPDAHHQSFDACIASHVVEHIPDPISFFGFVGKIMKENGILSLALPDKRWCFDFFRPLTTAAAWLEANRRGITKHTARTRFEYETYVVRQDSGIAWAESVLSNPTFAACDPVVAHQIFDKAIDTEQLDYVDCHAWCFTPSSFKLIVAELHALGEIDFRVVESSPTVGHEFFVTLIHDEKREVNIAKLQEERMRLMLQTARELKVQYDNLPRDLPCKAA